MTGRIATPADAPAVAALVQSAYRGDSSRAGWTTEADLLDDERIGVADVERKITAPRSAVLLLTDDGDVGLAGCCEVAARGDGLAYFGMFAVDPLRQAAGLGRELLARAERHAVAEWGATRMEMTVISARTELIAWYRRRGYVDTGETRPFPYEQVTNGRALRDDLVFAVLVKDL